MTRNKPTMCFVVVLIAVFPAWTSGATLNVPDDFATIQACIDAAQDSDECVVAPGTYHELIDFQGKAITLRSSDGPEVTIIDAGPVADPGTGKPVVRCDTDEGSDTALEGFTITGGTGDTTRFGSNNPVGGGMYNDHSNPTVTNCIFSGNTAGSFANPPGLGGGMYNGGLGDGDGSNPTVSNCTFIGNSAGSFGGGMYNRGSSNPTVTNCAFIGNSAYFDGGGMRNYLSNPTVSNCMFNGNSAGAGGGGGGGMQNQTSSPAVNDCTFTGNTAPSGGGMGNRDSNPTVINCKFTGNNATFAGGGMLNGLSSNPTVTNCMFSRNSVAGTGNARGGGGMFNVDANPTVTNCTFSENSVAGDGGGMYNSADASPTVTNCTFSDNSAGHSGGGGMFNNNNSSATVTNCTFRGNSASGTVASGGGIYNNMNSSPMVTNCTFTGNTASNGGGMFSTRDEIFGGTPTPALSNCILWGNAPDQILDGFGALTTVSDSNVQGAWPGTGNIDADPLFVDPDGADNTVGTEDGNLRLLRGSPCINTGDPALIPGPTATDLDGHARVLCMRIDMGAYEFGIGDFDCDQIVTLTDWADWAGCMTGPDAQSISPACQAFDFKFDGDVDLEDVGGFQRMFTGQ